MLQDLWTFVQRHFENNQVFSGGLVLMLGGALLAYFRELPAQLWSRIRGFWMIEIDILDRDPAFEWVELWLSRHRYSQTSARWLTVKTQPIDFHQRLVNPSIDPRPQILFSPAPGTHYLFFKGRLVIVHRERPNLSQAASQPVNVRESFSITIFTRNRALAQQLLEEARDIALPPGKKRLAIYRPSYSSWSESMQRLPRPAESVILRDHDLEDLIDDVRTFLARREWYSQRGLPYRRGYLLHGPPGTGKSSAALAVASELRMDLALLSLNSSSLEDNELGELLSDVPNNCIVLIEDIDCAFVQRAKSEEKTNRLTFSGLLNALDGVAAGEGRVLFATTNHPERLDPALVRPGRIDRKLEIGYADRVQMRRLFERFFPEGDPAMAELFAEMIPDRTFAMSALQTHLIRYAHDPDAALERLDDLFTEVNHPAQHPRLFSQTGEELACSVGL